MTQPCVNDPMNIDCINFSRGDRCTTCNIPGCEQRVLPSCTADPDREDLSTEARAARCKGCLAAECGIRLPGGVVARTSALDVQVGGGHYKDMKIQPVEFITKNNLGFLEGCVIKRVCRHGAKAGAQDLRKAIHELELMIELYYPGESK